MLRLKKSGITFLRRGGGGLSMIVVRKRGKLFMIMAREKRKDWSYRAAWKKERGPLPAIFLSRRSGTPACHRRGKGRDRLFTAPRREEKKREPGHVPTPFNRSFRKKKEKNNGGGRTDIDALCKGELGLGLRPVRGEEGKKKKAR